jgi:hypothetical protein
VNETGQAPLWQDEPKRRRSNGETRRALDRDLKAAEEEGQRFLATDKAALRRQANDIDRLEHMFEQGEAKPWDYSPKTQAHIAYREAVHRLFGSRDDDHDPFVEAVRQLERDEAAARARAAETLDPERREPAE